MRYSISQGLLRPPLEIEIDGVPPCLFCGDPVTRPSMDGPLVCARCDCGNNRDGSKWTEEQANERYAHRRAKVAEYRVQMIDRRVREMKELLSKMAAGPVRYTAIETGESRMEGGASDVAAFTVGAQKLMPDLIELYEQRGEEVAKQVAVSGAVAEERDRWPQTITIGNRTPFSGADRTASLRAAVGKLPLEDLLGLRALIDDPRRESGDAAQVFFERFALGALLAALPDFLAMCEEIAKLVKEDQPIVYEAITTVAKEEP